jgi:energy-coupling factor transport system ATP-binding protein
MLDPIAEKGFASLLFRVNRELDVTVVVATHAPAALAPYATLVLRVSDGRVAPIDLSELRRETQPSYSRAESPDPGPAPGPAPAHPTSAPAPAPAPAPDAASCVRLREAWYRYRPDAPWVLTGCDFDVAAGEVRAVVGGNASGKSTLLSLVAGIARPQRGRAENAAARSQALLPQSPKALLSKETVGEELMEWADAVDYGRDDALRLMGELSLADVPLSRHPYDLSGGQQQLLALAKLLLTQPRLLLLDEPTKGLDAAARRAVAEAVRSASARGATVVMATHDLPFARAVASSVSMLFDGGVTLTEPTAEFFERSWLWGDR